MKHLIAACLLSLLACSTLACARPSPQVPQSLQEVPAEQLFARALELAAQGEYVPAEQFLQAARARGYPENKVIKELLKVCLASSRLDGALGHAVPYLERNPDAWPLRQVVATIYLSQGDGPAARAELDQVIAQRPSHSEAHYLMAVVLRDEYADSDSARASFEQYLTLAPHGEHAPEVRAWLRRQVRQVNVELSKETVQ
jgi:tetratricopeptide (TPR) repeat protein